MKYISCDSDYFRFQPLWIRLTQYFHLNWLKLCKIFQEKELLRKNAVCFILKWFFCISFFTSTFYWDCKVQKFFRSYFTKSNFSLISSREFLESSWGKFTVKKLCWKNFFLKILKKEKKNSKILNFSCNDIFITFLIF